MAIFKSAIFPAVNVASSPKTVASTCLRITAFDRPDYQKLIDARGETIRNAVAQLQTQMPLRSALDAGCGVGFFSQVLRECGLDVSGFDGRMENVAEARRRFPEIPFGFGDLQAAKIRELGVFDLVLCFGLVYHLENPMLAIRHLRALTGKALLLESICLPGTAIDLMLREEPSLEDQSLTDIALYPSETCLVKMLYCAGYAGVYRILDLPDHNDFRDMPNRARRRTVLFASAVPLAGQPSGFELVAEPRDQYDPWSKEQASPVSETVPALPLIPRLQRFFARPWREQYLSLAHRARRVFPEMPIPWRLPFGVWWLAQKSALDEELVYGEFESAEIRFVKKLLRPGMTVIDAGAHHGLYTLLLSKQVGWRGKVLAFEPSPRECRRLQPHLWINFCGNTRLERCALGAQSGVADLFLVEGHHDWCNSLRPPVVKEPTCKVSVRVRRLDDVLEARGIERVDFIKLDVEGAELSFLQGATRLLSGKSRPAILAEVQDLRTSPWGYAAREIVQFLLDKNYRWFALTHCGSASSLNVLRPAPTDLEFYDANLVALPEERVEEFQYLLNLSD